MKYNCMAQALLESVHLKKLRRECKKEQNKVSIKE
jgi:hypothetical protein